MAGAALSGGEGRAMAQASQEFYQLRKYTLRNGSQLALTQSYFEHALIPALNRMSITPGGCIQAGYRSGDADLLSAHSGNVSGSVGNAGHAAGAGRGIPQSVDRVLGSAGCDACL